MSENIWDLALGDDVLVQSTNGEGDQPIARGVVTGYDTEYNVASVTVKEGWYQGVIVSFSMKDGDHNGRQLVYREVPGKSSVWWFDPIQWRLVTAQQMFEAEKAGLEADVSDARAALARAEAALAEFLGVNS